MRRQQGSRLRPSSPRRMCIRSCNRSLCNQNSFQIERRCGVCFRLEVRRRCLVTRVARFFAFWQGDRIRHRKSSCRPRWRCSQTSCRAISWFWKECRTRRYRWPERFPFLRMRRLYWMNKFFFLSITDDLLLPAFAEPPTPSPATHFSRIASALPQI